MKESSPYEQEFKLWVMLEQAHSAVFAAREKELMQYATSPMKTAVLFIVQSIGKEATPAEIARWIGIERVQHTVAAAADEELVEGERERRAVVLVGSP